MFYLDISSIYYLLYWYDTVNINQKPIRVNYISGLSSCNHVEVEFNLVSATGKTSNWFTLPRSAWEPRRRRRNIGRGACCVLNLLSWSLPMRRTRTAVASIALPRSTQGRQRNVGRHITWGERESLILFIVYAAQDTSVNNVERSNPVDA